MKIIVKHIRKGIKYNRIKVMRNGGKREKHNMQEIEVETHGGPHF
jgi:hypothetical protein